MLLSQKQALEVFLFKKLFLKASQNSLENTRVRVCFLIKLQASGLQLYQKTEYSTTQFVNFAKFLENVFLTEHP